MTNTSLKQMTSSTARAVYQHDLDGDSGIEADDGVMMRKDLHLMGLTPHLMTLTTSVLPISIGILS